ncbi:unnamed protein product [Amaranthus hypochondriacus]
MASSQKFGCILFLLIISFFSIQTHARESQFFSKFTRNGETTTTSTTPNTDYNPNNNEKEFVHLKKQSDEQPVFIPQTTETGYGLYGHETGLDPPSTTLYNMDDINNNNNENLYNNNENFNTNNNNNEYHEKNYATELQGLSSTSYTNNNYKNNNNNYKNNNYENNNKNNYENYNNNNNYENYNNNNNKGEGKFYGGAGYNGVQEKQGMSDTRFMYNGKYFYDVEAEKRSNYNPNNNNFMSYSNNYNNNGYYGNKMNNFEEFYSNNNNNNKFYNGNEYQNQFPEEEEFDFDQP